MLIQEQKMAPPLVLLETLKHLEKGDFKEYKLYLQQLHKLTEFPAIPKSRLEDADRIDTADLMMQTYSHECLEVNRRVLEKMKRKDLLEDPQTHPAATCSKVILEVPGEEVITTAEEQIKQIYSLKLCAEKLRKVMEGLELLYEKPNLFKSAASLVEAACLVGSSRARVPTVAPLLGVAAGVGTDFLDSLKAVTQELTKEETTQAKQESGSSGTHRQCTIWIKNKTKNHILRNPSEYIFSGRCDTSLPSTLHPSGVGRAVYAKTPHTACGSVGVLSYELYDESTARADKKIAIMFSVPYDFNIYCNWHAVGVFNKDTLCDYGLYKEMYHMAQKGFVRGKAKDPSLTYKEDDVTIESTMTNTKEPILRVDISSNCKE